MTFRTKGSPKRATLLARTGIVVGGDFDGWRYGFERITVSSRGAVILIDTEPLVNAAVQIQGLPA